MPKIVIHHEVEDTDRWLTAGKGTRENFFGPLGITDIKTYTNPQNPQQVALTMDVPDLDAMMAALETPEASEAEKTPQPPPNPSRSSDTSTLSRPRPAWSSGMTYTARPSRAQSRLQTRST